MKRVPHPDAMMCRSSDVFEEMMKGYHDLRDHGRREIYKLEG
jgi:hypothetical protein